MPSAINEPTIIDVWNYNVEEEFAKMRDTLEKYPYVAMVCCLKVSLFRAVWINVFKQVKRVFFLSLIISALKVKMF